MAYKDLREFMKTLEKHGEMQRIPAEVDWNLEMGAIARKCNEMGAPAPFAEKVKGYPSGHRLMAGILSGSKVNGSWAPYRRTALAFGMDPDTPPQELVEAYIEAGKNPIKPVEVSTGPVKENIIVGDDVDLFKLPAPVVHGGDGGRYISTWHATINQDPDTGWVNWGMYRSMIVDKNKLAGLLIPYQHGPSILYQKYEARGKAMPFAIAIGGDPVIAFIASSFLPAYVNEADVAGGLRKEPVELVKCETNDLMVPATSEIVIEGEIRPHERVEEGPFGEFTGFRTTERGGRPLYRVKAITHRNDPILTMSCMGAPCDEYAALASITISGEILQILRHNGIPVRGVCVHPWGNTLSVIVSTKVPYANVAHQISSMIWGSKAGVYIHWIIVVDENVDPWSLEDVFHAVVFQCNPKEGIHVYKRTLGMTLDAFLSPHDRAYGLGKSALIDATFPWEWEMKPIVVSINNPQIYPESIQQKVKGRWVKEYGYKEKY